MIRHFIKQNVIYFTGEIQVCNAFEASDIIINPRIAEADGFKELFNEDKKSLTICESREGKLELKTINEVQDKA